MGGTAVKDGVAERHPSPYSAGIPKRLIAAMMPRAMPAWIGFILVMLAGAALLMALAVCLMAWGLLAPPRMTDGKAAWLLGRVSPDDMGLGFEPMRFDVRDEQGRRLSIAAWWMGHADAQGRCILLVHGYADAKVGALAWAPTLHELGWNILAVDLRAHGESGGRFHTGGYFERHDLMQVIDQARLLLPGQTRRMALMGLSIGSSVVAATASMRDDLAGVILDSPPAGHREGFMLYSDQKGSPGALLQRMALRAAEWISGADFGAVRLAEQLEGIPCPLLLIVGGDDPLADRSRMGDVERILTRRLQEGQADQFWAAPDAGHLMAIVADPAAYRQRLSAFLSRL